MRHISPPTVSTLTAEEAQAAYGRNTLGVDTRLAGAFIPQSAEGVQEVLRYAQENNLRLWPISTGRNYGYGCATPAQHDNWILDLSAMQGIELNEALRTVTIEPGVTQGMLRAYLDVRGLRDWIVPTTGAGPLTSLLGNALEGGYGLTPNGNHFAAVQEFQGFWGSGEAFCSAYRELGCPTAASIWRQGVGPQLQGLLHQSNFGVVTKMTVGLARVPKGARLVILRFQDEAHMCASIAAIAEFSEANPGFKGPLFSAPKRSITTAFVPEVAQLPKGSGREQAWERLVQKSGLPRWSALAFVYGTKRVAAAMVRDLAKLDSRMTVLTFPLWAERPLQLLSRVVPGNSAVHAQLRSLQGAFDLMQGRPTAEFLQMAYAGIPSLSNSANLSPSRDAGILWFAPVLPADGAVVASFMHEVCTPVLVRHGFDLLYGFTLRDSRCMTAVTPLIFDRNSAVEVKNAQQCLSALTQACLNAGFPPYRMGITSYGPLASGPMAGASHTWQQLKQCLDPAGVLAPGHYIPTPQN